MKAYTAPKLATQHLTTQHLQLTFSTHITGSAYDAPTWDDTPTSDEALVKTTVVEWDGWE